MICLDTNMVIVMLGGTASPVRSRFEDAARNGLTLATSSIVLFELWYGIGKSILRAMNAKKLAEFISSPIEVLEFNADDAKEAGDIRAVLALAGTPIGPYDVLIAAQARRRNAVLVTSNTREFARVPRLKIEDWASP